MFGAELIFGLLATACFIMPNLVLLRILKRKRGSQPEVKLGERDARLRREKEAVLAEAMQIMGLTQRGQRL